MEVHHHPDLHHKKKKFKEFLAEFIMIFLAVTLGFFAETIREKISEGHREKNYIIGLINNVENDTAGLKGLIERNDLEIRGIDSLTKIAKGNFTNINAQDSVYYYSTQYTLSLHLFQFNDLTLVQLRNAGGYSLIIKDHVADSIAQYESNNADIKLQERFVIDYYVKTWDVFKQVFDGTVANQFFTYFDTTNKIPLGVNVLISKDEEKMRVLLNNYWTYGLTLRSYNYKLKQHLVYLTGFISYLKKSYDID